MCFYIILQFKSAHFCVYYTTLSLALVAHLSISIIYSSISYLDFVAHLYICIIPLKSISIVYSSIYYLDFIVRLPVSIISLKSLSIVPLSIPSRSMFIFSKHKKRLRGYVLLSQAVAHQVPSALRSLTSVFGMGTGVSSLL